MLVYQRVSVRKPSKDEVFIVLWWCLSSQLVLPQKGVRVSLPQGQRLHRSAGDLDQVRCIMRYEKSHDSSDTGLDNLLISKSYTCPESFGSDLQSFFSQCRPFEGPT